jgi:hypothetical protein
MEIAEEIGRIETSNFSQDQGQFRTTAELDSPHAARQGEPAGLRVSQIKELDGDVPWYVAQEIPQIDKEIAEKGRFRTETN